MKKIISLILALVMVMALSVTAFATNFEGATGTGDVGIVADFEIATDNKQDILNGAAGTKVYSLTLSWVQNGTISYNAGKTTYSWNKESLEYDSKESDKGWTVPSGANVVITAVNRSNRDVQISCGDPNAISGVTISGSYTTAATFTVLSAATGGFEATGAEQTGSATYSISSVSGDGWNGIGNIGTITVTITGQ